MLTRIHPFYRDLNAFERAVFGGRATPSQEVAVTKPPIDVREETDAFVIDLELPGVARDAIDIGVERGVLTVRAERQRPASGNAPKDLESAQHGEDQGTDEGSAEINAESDEPARYQLKERRMGVFERTLRLPDTVDVDGIEAQLVYGVLELRLPKREAPGTRKISVRAA